MAEDTKRGRKDAAAQDGDEAASATKPLWQRLLPSKRVALLLGVSVINFAIGFSCAKILSRKGTTDSGVEVSLGDFQFEAHKSELSKVVNAEFSLHLALLEQTDDEARRLLKSHEQRVRQNVEELLRQAHGGDFEDPTLGGVKRQIQERVNQTIGMRAIADVVITDLKLGLSDPVEVPEVTHTAGPVP